MSTRGGALHVVTEVSLKMSSKREAMLQRHLSMRSPSRFPPKLRGAGGAAGGTTPGRAQGACRAADSRGLSGHGDVLRALFHAALYHLSGWDD